MAVISVEAVRNDPALQNRVRHNINWYTSYGSNMFPDRIAWYFNGEQGKGARRYQSFYKDRVGTMFAGKIPHRMGFAEISKIWAHGGKGFVDINPEPNPDLHAYAVSYALSPDQFDHLVGEENWQSERWLIHEASPTRDREVTDREFVHEKPIGPSLPPVEQRVDEFVGEVLAGGPVTKPTGYESSYNTLLLVGFAPHPDHAHIPDAPLYPVVTFTRERALDGAEDLNSPSSEYLQMLASGLATAVPDITDDAIAEYLANSLGTGVDIAGRAQARDIQAPVSDQAKKAGGPFEWTNWTVGKVARAVEPAVSAVRQTARLAVADPRRELPRVTNQSTERSTGRDTIR